MKALLAAAVALAGLQGCDPGGGGPKCDAISAKASPLLIYVVGHDTVYSKETDAPPAPQALRRGEIPVRPAAWTKDTIPKPHLVCVTIYAGPLP